MSFILESLKRAEQERQGGETPVTERFYEQSGLPDDTKRPKRYWMVGLLIGNLVVVAFLAIFLMQRWGAPQVAAPTPEEARPAIDATEQVEATVSPPEDQNRMAAATVAKPEKKETEFSKEIKTPVPKKPVPAEEPDARTTVRFGPPVVADVDDGTVAAVDVPPRVLPPPAGAGRTASGQQDPSFEPASTPSPVPPVKSEKDLETEVVSESPDARAMLSEAITDEPQWVTVPPQSTPAPTPVFLGRCCRRPSPMNPSG